MFNKCRFALSLLSLLIFTISIMPGCSSPGSDTGGSAEPTFCPTRFSSSLPSPLAVGDSPPRAYYQDISVRADTTISVTLYACDPDDVTSSEGLSWVITAPPSVGTLSTTGGVYPNGFVTYTPDPAFAGTDTFWYQVMDAEGASSSPAEVRVAVEPRVTSFSCSGPATVDEGSSGAYSVSLTYNDGSVADVTSSVSWALSPQGSASIDATGNLDPGNVPGDQPVLVLAQYNEPGGPVWNDSLAVTLIDTTAILTGVAIAGPATIDEASVASYTASAHWDDGTDTDVTLTASWAVSGAGTFQAPGDLLAAYVTSDTAVTVTATYQGQAGTASLTILDVTALLTGVTVGGPATVDEGNSASFWATAHWDDLSATDITNSASWAVTPAGFGTVDSSGLFTAGTVGSDQDVTVLANYTDGINAFANSSVITVVYVPPTGPTTWHVDIASPAGTAGDGLSWNTAYVHPQMAMDQAASGDSVLVAEGQYQPISTADPTVPVLTMVSDVSIYGGYLVSSGVVLNRDPDIYTSVLDGDADGDNVGDVANVVWAADNVLVDGFTITHGNANNVLSFYPYHGGGMQVGTSSGVTVSNCRFVDNNANKYGGGLWAYNSGVNVIDCVFEGNTAERGAGTYLQGTTTTVTGSTFFNNVSTLMGGGLFAIDGAPLSVHSSFFTSNQGTVGGAYIDGSSTAAILFSDCSFTRNTEGGSLVTWADTFTVKNSNFSDNQSAGFGGGLYTDTINTVIVDNCTFDRNTTSSEGGGMMVGSVGDVTVKNSVFNSNQATYSGAGMYSIASSLAVTGSIFTNNDAGWYGGGIFQTGGSFGGMDILGSRFEGNSAQWFGGALEIEDTDSLTREPNIINSIFTNNSMTNASGYGGAISHLSGGYSSIVNCSFNGNSAGASAPGGAVYTDPPEVSTIINSVLWGNSAGVLFASTDEVGGSTTLITWSDVETPGSAYPGAGNIMNDPSFTDSLLTISAVSDCIDAGTDLSAFGITTDYAGTARPLGTAYDIGAWEVAANLPPVVTVSLPPSPDEGSLTFITGSWTEPDGDDFNYTVDWNFGDATGTGVIVAGSKSHVPSHTYADNGTYSVLLTVTGASGAAGADTATLTVLNVAPTATIAGSTSAAVDQTLGFLSSISDPGTADTHALSWDFGDGSPGSTAANPSHAFTAAGNFTVLLTADDHDGGIGTDSLVVTVTSSNSPPVPIIGAPSTTFEGDPVPVGVTIGDPDGPTPYGYILDFGDGNSDFGTTSLGSISSGNIYADNGTYTIFASVTDGAAAAGTTSWTVYVFNVAPVAAAFADTLYTVVDQVILFDGSGSSDIGSDILTYSWDFGDGSSATAFTTDPTASYAYTFEAAFTAILTVRDDDGGQDTDNLSMLIFPAGPVAWYVDLNSPAGTGGDGTTWSTAFLHPANAMAVAASGEQVWVAAGTYAPLSTVDQTVPVLAMALGVEVYGGFAGTETALDQRDTTANVTILDGDKDGDLTGDIYHVVTGASNALLDGFTLTRGNADSFSGSAARGGGMFNDSVTGLVVKDCSLVDSYAEQAGSGMYSYASSVRVESCFFYNNIIYGGDATSGGAMSNELAISTEVISSVFESNYGDYGAGGIHNVSGDLTVRQSRFTRNTAEGGGPGGGGIYMAGGTAQVENCIFTENYGIDGGGILAEDGGTVNVVHSSFNLNTSYDASGGHSLETFGDGSITVVNSILWGTNDAEILGSVGVTYSDVAMASAPFPGVGNTNSDPAFADSLLTIPATSPGADAGTDAGVTVDYAGHTRPYDGDNDGTASMDMGAWEWIIPPEGSLFMYGDIPSLFAGPQLISWDAANGFAYRSSGPGGVPNLRPADITAYNGKLYFDGSVALDHELWSWDAVDGLTRITFNDFSPGDMAVYDGLLYFTADAGGVNQLWTIDSGNVLSQFTTVSGGFSGYQFADFDGKLFFVSSGGLWSLDSVNAPAPVPTTGGPGPLSPQDLEVYNDKLYFAGDVPATVTTTTDNQLWSYDATNGFSMVSTTSGQWGIDPEYLTVLDGSLYFQGYTGAGRNLFSYNDQTNVITWETAYPVIGDWGNYFTVFDDKLFFSVEESNNVRQLYSYSSSAGLQLAASSAAPSGMWPYEMTVYDKKLYFAGYDLGDLGNNVSTLWSYSSSGTAETVSDSTGISFSGDKMVPFNPDNPPIADANGTWTFDETITADGCDGYVGSVYTSRVAITQLGNSLLVKTPSDTTNIVISGDKITGSNTYPDGAGVSTEIYSLTLSSTGNTITGSSTWDWTDEIDPCSGVSTWQGWKD